MEPYSPHHLAGVWRRLRQHPVTGRSRETAVGVDGTRAAVFEKNLEASLREISRRIMRAGADGLPSYRFGPLLRHEKLKPNGGVRPIHIPRLRDQIVLRAMHEDLVAAGALAGLSLRSALPVAAVGSFRSVLRPDSVVLRADVANFFDSVPRARAIEAALALPVMSTTAGLLQVWDGGLTARMPWTAGKESDMPAPGLPQGLSLSASLAELWASRLDRHEHVPRFYFRYVDDIAVVCAGSREAENALDWLVAATKQAGLLLSPSKTAILRIGEGVRWLGLVHYNDRVIVEDDRPERWLKRFAAIRREAAAALRLPSADKSAVLADFHRAVCDEISGRTSSRPAWYATVEDRGEWRRMDRSLHALIRSVHRQAGAPPPHGRQLPSIHRAVCSRRKLLSAPSTAEQGPCATLLREGETTADQGHKAPDGAELSSCMA